MTKENKLTLNELIEQLDENIKKMDETNRRLQEYLNESERKDRTMTLDERIDAMTDGRL